MSETGQLINAEELRHRVAELFAARGMSQEDAQSVSDALLWADVRGVDTHGIARIAQYFSFIERGDLDPIAKPELKVDLLAAVMLNAHRSAGPVAMREASKLLQEKARAAGIGFALVSHTTHTGALGYYTQSLARQGFIGIAMSATTPFIVYPDTRAAGVGTNPVSIAVPGAGSDPIVLDMTTGATSMGTLNLSRRDNRPLAPGLAADAQGQPTTDPQLAKMLLPMAGGKGAGLSLMIELIASHLSANPLIAEALEGTPDSKRHRQNALLLAIDGSRFCAPEAYAQSVGRLAADILGLPRLDPAKPAHLPGERGDLVQADRLRNGIPVPQKVMAELADLAQQLKLDWPDAWSRP